jgi:hypothetical protein
MVVEEADNGGRRPVLVPRHVAEELAPHIAAHNDGSEDPQVLAEHFATHADSYIEADKEDTNAFKRTTRRAGNGIRSLFSDGKASDNNEFASTIHAQNSDEYSSDMVDLLDVIGRLTQVT